MEEFIKIAILENAIEAQLLDSIMGEQNIPHRLRSFHDTAYDGLFQFHKGWGEVYAPGEFKDEIRKMLETIRSEA